MSVLTSHENDITHNDTITNYKKGHTMMRTLRTYFPFTKGVVQAFMAYRANFYVYVLGDMFQTVVLLYIWFAIFSSATSKVIQGFTFEEMIGYVVISTLTSMLISNEVHWDISHDVQSGDIAMSLIKPVNYQLLKFFSAMGNILVNITFLFIPLWGGYTIYDFVANGALPSIASIFLYFVSVLLSMLILFYINYLFGLAAFFVEYVFGFIFAKEAIMRLLSGQLIPLSFFPASVLAVFKFLPFAGLVYTPTMLYLGKFSGPDALFYIIVQVVWVMLLMGLTQLIWKKAIKRLTIMGG